MHVMHMMLAVHITLGLACLEQTLTPRARGTYLAVKELHGYLTAVFDITIAYESTRRPSADGQGFYRSRAPGMIEFITSYSPKLHVNVRKLDMENVPHEDPVEVTKWLHSCYERKDKSVL